MKGISMMKYVSAVAWPLAAWLIVVLSLFIGGEVFKNVVWIREYSSGWDYTILIFPAFVYLKCYQKRIGFLGSLFCNFIFLYICYSIVFQLFVSSELHTVSSDEVLSVVKTSLVYPLYGSVPGAIIFSPVYLYIRRCVK